MAIRTKENCGNRATLKQDNLLFVYSGCNYNIMPPPGKIRFRVLRPKVNQGSQAAILKAYVTNLVN